MEKLDLKQFEHIAVVAVDVQNDFCPGGSLAVTEGDLVVPPLNLAIDTVQRLDVARRKNSSPKLPVASVIATRDWHPAITSHFSATPDFVNNWPVHCVADTLGAEFHSGLNVQSAIIVQKGTQRDEDAYSGFEGKTAHSGEKITEVIGSSPEKTALFIGGLATDYCIQATVKDAARLGFNTYVLSDAIKGVAEASSQKAIEQMQAVAKFITSEQLDKTVKELLG